MTIISPWGILIVTIQVGSAVKAVFPCLGHVWGRLSGGWHPAAGVKLPPPPDKSGFRKLEAPWRLSPRAAINPYRQIDRHLSILHRLINAYGATH